MYGYFGTSGLISILINRFVFYQVLRVTNKGMDEKRFYIFLPLIAITIFALLTYM